MFYTRAKEYLANHPARRDLFVLVNFWLCLVLYPVLWFLVLLLAQPVSHSLVLHYNIYFGVDFLGPWTWLLVYPALAGFLVVLNFGLALFLYTKEKLLSLVLIQITTIVQIIFLIAVSLIYSINI
ncbi:MAG: hypothetical protein WCW02_02045 [Candidatus Buchananbacteria bacterium]